MSDGVTPAFNTQPFPPALVPGGGARRLPGLSKDALKATHLCRRMEKCVFPSQLSRRIPANPDTSPEEVSGMHWQRRRGSGGLGWAAPPAGWVGLLSTTLAIKTRHLSERGHGKEEGKEEEDWSVGRLQLGVQPRRHRVEGPMRMLASPSSPSPCPSLLHPRSTGDKS